MRPGASVHPRLSERVAAIPASGIRAIAAAAAARPDTVHLEIGEPAGATPVHVVAAADAAARAGRTHYGPSAGLPELREAVAAKLVRDNGWRPAAADPSHVVVAAGGVGALFAAYAAVLDPGDEVLVPDPGWPNFRALARTLGAVPVGYPLDPVTGALPDAQRLDALTGPRTRAVVVNSPANPTGAVNDAAELAALSRWASRNGIVVISDECYDRLGLDAPSASTAACAPDASVVSVFSLSKSYAMTGWRVGYAVAPPTLAAAMTRVQEATASCVSTVAQLAGVAALTGPQDDVERMRRGYALARDAAVHRCTELGLVHLRPRGAFYLWITLPEGAPDAERFARDLLDTHGVAVAPGTAFGPAGARHLRVSLAAPVEHVLAGLAAVADAAAVAV